LVSEFDEPAGGDYQAPPNPCGASTGASVVEAYRRAARVRTRFSAFGGVIGINREVDEAAAEDIAKALR